MLDFAMIFVNFGKNTTMLITTHHVLYFDPNDFQEFSCQMAKGYWDEVQE
jgi:hypothetical protein